MMVIMPADYVCNFKLDPSILLSFHVIFFLYCNDDDDIKSRIKHKFTYPFLMISGSIGSNEKRFPFRVCLGVGKSKQFCQVNTKQ